MFRSFSALSLSFVCLVPTTLAASSVSLAVPGKTSDTRVSSSLNPSYAGFGIEPSNLFSFTGNEGPNNFSINLMQNLADFSGAPPHIRLGGNTQDYMLFNGSFEDYRVMDNPNSVAQGAIAADHMIIGPAYFRALERFPKDTPVTFGLNLAYQAYDWQDRIVDMAQAAVDGMKNVKLYSFEVGNEPDLWTENLFRPGVWTGQTYTDEFFARAEVVYKNVLQPAGIPSAFFEPPATASTIGTTFEIKMLTDHGILEEYNGNKYVSTWNQHDYYYFIGVTKTSLTLDQLMDLDTTETQFKYWAQQVNIALDTGYDYALREMSCVGPIGMPFVSDTFGAALWTLNFFMYAATLDISSVQMHMTDNSNASAWLPISKYGMDPHVRPAYYAYAAVAQVIGNGNGTTQIGEVDTSKVGGDYSGRIRTYMAFANGDLRSLILINSKPANASVANKDSFTFELALPTSFAGQEVYLSYLNAEGSDSLHGATWNGMTFSDVDGTIGIADDEVGKMTVDDSGKITIPVRDSQAVVANIGWQLGSNPVLPGDGTKIAGTRKSNASGLTKNHGANTAIWAGLLMSLGVLVRAMEVV